MERVQTLVIGGGQAGLAVGYHLQKLGQQFLILDAEARIGDAWRKRWDSLRLFTPAYLSSLPGMKLGVPARAFIGKDHMADYLEAYAKRFKLPVRSGVRVDGLSRVGDRYVVTAGAQRFEADNVVVAMAQYQQPRRPDYAAELDTGIVQLHSTEYKNAAQLKPGPVLVVGVGNSGADIAVELVKSHPTFLAGKESGATPFRPDSFMAHLLFFRLMKLLGHHILTVRTPLGRKFRPKLLKLSVPLIRVKPQDITAAGVERVERVSGVKDGQPVLVDGRRLEVANVIWASGFRPGFDWIRLPVLGQDGMPQHERGVVTSEPGLYFVGLRFLFSMTSDTITGVGRDAERIATAIARRRKAAAA